MKKNNSFKVIFRIIEILIWICVALVLLARGSDCFLWTAFIDKLASLPFVGNIFDLGTEEYQAVDIEDPYYQELLTVLEQIAPAEDIKNIQWSRDWDDQKIFRIDLHNGEYHKVLVEEKDWGFTIKLREVK
jgi:hypothetical protein